MSLTCRLCVYCMESQNFRARTTWDHLFQTSHYREEKNGGLEIKIHLQPQHMRLTSGFPQDCKPGEVLCSCPEMLQRWEGGWGIPEPNIKTKKKTLGKQKVVGFLSLSLSNGSLEQKRARYQKKKKKKVGGARTMPFLSFTLLGRSLHTLFPLFGKKIASAQCQCDTSPEQWGEGEAALEQIQGHPGWTHLNVPSCKGQRVARGR